MCSKSNDTSNRSNSYARSAINSVKSDKSLITRSDISTINQNKSTTGPKTNQRQNNDVDKDGFKVVNKKNIKKIMVNLTNNI